MACFEFCLDVALTLHDSDIGHAGKAAGEAGRHRLFDANAMDNLGVDIRYRVRHVCQAQSIAAPKRPCAARVCLFTPPQIEDGILRLVAFDVGDADAHGADVASGIDAIHECPRARTAGHCVQHRAAKPSAILGQTKQLLEQ